MAKLKQKPKSKGNPKTASQTPTLTKQELAAQKRQAAKVRQEFISALGQAIGLGSVLGAIGFAVGGVKAGIGGLLAVVVLLLSNKYPRQALWAFLIYMPFSGTVTYWIGGGSPLFQLAKDGFYIPALLGIYKYCQRERLPFMVPKALGSWIYALLGYCILVILAVNTPKGGFAMGVFGLKVLMGYIPLMFCAYYLLRGKKEFLFCTRLHVILAIICCLACLFQYQSLTSGRCAGTQHLSGADLFKATLDARCYFGGSLVYSPQVGMIRLPSTFVSPWHWGWFLIGNIFLTFASAFSDPSALWRGGGLIGMALVFVCALISGQRIALALVPVITVILLILTGQLTNLKRFIPIAIGLGVLGTVAMVMFPDVINERVGSLVGRWTAAPPTDFIAGQAEHAAGQDGFLGSGLGRATNSARAFGPISLIETWFPKVLFEIGWPGLIIFLLMVSAITFQAFKAYRSVKEKNLRSFGACFWVLVLIISYQTYWYPLDTDPICVYYWFFAGAIFRLPVIDKEEQQKALEEEQQGLLITGKKAKNGKPSKTGKKAKVKLKPKPG